MFTMICHLFFCILWFLLLRFCECIYVTSDFGFTRTKFQFFNYFFKHTWIWFHLVYTGVFSGTEFIGQSKIMKIEWFFGIQFNLESYRFKSLWAQLMNNFTCTCNSSYNNTQYRNFVHNFLICLCDVGIKKETTSWRKLSLLNKRQIVIFQKLLQNIEVWEQPTQVQ